MKKVILVFCLFVGFAAATAAQPRAIGGRVGWALEASYQHEHITGFLPHLNGDVTANGNGSQVSAVAQEYGGTAISLWASQATSVCRLPFRSTCSSPQTSVLL